jgi:hypothetical protein
MRLIKPEFFIPYSKGSTEPKGFFPEGMVEKVDQGFREVVTKNGDEYAEGPLRCQLFEATEGIPFGQLRLNSSQICCALSYLGGEGSALLDIQPGENEENIAIGMAATADGVDVILVVEREDTGKVHLHAVVPQEMDDDITKFFVIG